MESWFFWELLLPSAEPLLPPHKTCLTEDKEKLLVMVIGALFLCFPRNQNQDRCLVYLYDFERNNSSFVKEARLGSTVPSVWACLRYVQSFLIILG